MASNIADQAKANEQGRQMYCVTWLTTKFKLSTQEMMTFPRLLHHGQRS